MQNHAGEFTGLLPAVDGAELGEAHGQVAVGARLGRINLHVVRTVHRFEQEAVDELVVREHAVLGDGLRARELVDLLGEMHRHGVDAVRHLGAGAAGGDKLVEEVALDDRRELRVFVVGEVATGLVEGNLADVRREDLRVVLLAQLAEQEVLQLLADDGAGGGPEDEALADLVVDVEKLEFLAELAVIAELRLLELHEVVGEFLLRRESGAVDALELLVGLVAAVVGAGDGEELEGLQLGGVADVRAGAEVGELAVGVERDLLALGDVGQAAQLEAFLAARLDDLDGFLAGDFLAVKALVLVRDLFHLGLDLREVVHGQLVVEVDVVIEAGVGRRADVELGLRE